MLDLELVTPPTDDVTDIVDIPELRRHLRISPSNTAHDEELKEVLEEVVSKLEGRDGELNRSIRPCTWRRWLPRFPLYSRVVQLPYPPLLSVESVYYGGDSPQEMLAETDYIVRLIGGHGVVGEIELLRTLTWPSISPANARGVAITYRAGYTTYPPVLKRMIKIMLGHYWENREATINENRVMQINRAMAFGMQDLRSALRVPVAMDDWE
jgi:hypothetical protein